MSKQVCPSHGAETMHSCERCGNFICLVCTGSNVECPPCVDLAMAKARGGKHLIAIVSVLFASLLCTSTIETGVWVYHLKNRSYLVIPGMALGLNLLLLPYLYFIACFVVNTCHRAQGLFLWEKSDSARAIFALPAISNGGLLFVCLVFDFIILQGKWSLFIPFLIFILGSATAIQLLTLFVARRLLNALGTMEKP